MKQIDQDVLLVLKNASAALTNAEIFEQIDSTADQEDISRALYRLRKDNLVIKSGTRPPVKGKRGSRSLPEYSAITEQPHTDTLTGADAGEYERLAEAVEATLDPETVEPLPLQPVTASTPAEDKHQHSALERIYIGRIDAAASAVEAYSEYALSQDPRYLALIDARQQAIHDLYDVRAEQRIEEAA